MSSLPDPVSARQRQWTLRRRLSVTFVVVGLLVVAETVVAAGALGRLNSAQHRQVDRLDPAIQTNTDLYISLLNQETGVRGYALTRNPTFLDPYIKGREGSPAIERRLRAQVATESQVEPHVQILIAAASRWQSEYATGALAIIRATPKDVIPPVQFSRGKGLFDQIRQDYARVNDSFALARRQARRQLSDSTSQLVGLVVGAALLTALISLALWIALRRWINRPLTALRAEVRTVAAGNLEHSIAAIGPPDIVELGMDAELMRLRMLKEYLDAIEARGQAQASALQVSAQASELRRSNAELEQFAYIASHDLQEPLRKVASFCQLLERRYSGQLDERADQYIAFAVDGAKRMQNLINDLLAFSRVGRSTASFRTVSLDGVVAGAISDLETRITESGAHVEVGDLPEVPGDPGLLRQLFMNLIGNGVKFHGGKTPFVRVSADREGDFWSFTVADNGIGIDPRYAEKVFAIFSRLHAREDYVGTGIGLALCRKIVEFHGGTIRVAPADQSPTAGATLIFTLPFQATPTPAPTAAPTDIHQGDHDPR